MRHSLPSAADSAATAEGRLRPAVLPLGQSRVHTHSPEREGFPLGSHSTTAGSRTVCQPEAGGVGKRKASFHSVKCVPSPSHCQAPNQGQGRDPHPSAEEPVEEACPPRAGWPQVAALVF